jgi:hypothetical protein
MDRAPVETLTRLVAAKGSRRVALTGLLATVLLGMDPQPTAAQCRSKEGQNKRQCRRRHRENTAPGGDDPDPSDKCAVARSYDPATRQPDLSGRDFSGCDLEETTLSQANLSQANLSNANLFRLDRANLRGADLSFADLSLAELPGANLLDADLFGANLTDAHLTGANLLEADLFGANLTGANLRDANLRRANLFGVDLTRVRWGNTICPDGTNSDANGGTCEGHLG